MDLAIHENNIKPLLQDERVDPSAGNNYAICWAAIHDHTEIVRLLLNDQRVDPNALNNVGLCTKGSC